ncbi:MAG: trypsin-like peptidase domain-containing protein [Clostridia bacterium]|jgi:serine protease Do|nr:trypsin-like peptidase domain-containing protein [Clostridia bacterium]
MQKYKRVKRKTKNVGKNIFIAFILVIIVVFIASLIRLYLRIDVKNSNESLKVERTTKEIQTEVSKEKTIEEIIEEVNLSVVGISKIKEIGSSIFTEKGIEKLGLGTGIIATTNGYIVTNRHVSGDKFSNCYVTLENGSTYDAKVVWADETLDLSIVKINLTGLKPAKFGDSNSVKAGEPVYAIGNPIGYEFERTVTAGIISAKSRTIKFIEDNKEILMSDLIQTDATINPGNSGGPLINQKGEVIGINSLKIETAEGIGFAVPVNVIKPIIEKFASTGNFEEPYIGVSGYDKNIIPYINKDLKLDSGVYIENVEPNSPAYEVGLLKGDIILKIDDKPIYTMNDIKEYIYTKTPGETIKMEYKRGNNTNTLKLTLRKR